MQKKSTVLIFILILCLSYSPAFAETFFNWGTKLPTYRNSLRQQNPLFEEYKFGDLRNYQNQILNYIIAINSNLSRKTVILRDTSSPQTDYIFVNNKLYSIKKEYGSLKILELKQLTTCLDKKYGQAVIQANKQMKTYLYSYQNSKILLKHNISSQKTIIYYYPTDLFKMLILE